MVENYKRQNLDSYNNIAKQYEEQTKGFIQEYILSETNKFLSLLPGKKILDLGSGPGLHAQYFDSYGFNTLCIDNSKEMIKLCLEKGLKAELMDFEFLNFNTEIFDGVWAYTSLLHTPKKNIESSFQSIASILKPKGVFFLGMKEGNDEGFVTNKRGTRFFSTFKKTELEEILNPYFHILNTRTFSTGYDYNLINFLCRKK